jgi:hypothetical protein
MGWESTKLCLGRNREVSNSLAFKGHHARLFRREAENHKQDSRQRISETGEQLIEIGVWSAVRSRVCHRAEGGVDTIRLERIGRGEGRLPLRILLDIAKALKVRPSTLLKGI